VDATDLAPLTIAHQCNSEIILDDGSTDVGNASKPNGGIKKTNSSSRNDYLET